MDRTNSFSDLNINISILPSKLCVKANSHKLIVQSTRYPVSHWHTMDRLDTNFTDTRYKTGKCTRQMHKTGGNYKHHNNSKTIGGTSRSPIHRGDRGWKMWLVCIFQDTCFSPTSPSYSRPPRSCSTRPVHSCLPSRSPHIPLLSWRRKDSKPQQSSAKISPTSRPYCP